MSYEKGLQEVGDGLYAYLQPDGGWGWSNAGLVGDGERAAGRHAVGPGADQRMLEAMRDAMPAAASIDTLVNTHANGDHATATSSRRRADHRLRAHGRGDDRAAARGDGGAGRAGAAMGEVGEFFLQMLRRVRLRRASS